MTAERLRPPPFFLSSTCRSKGPTLSWCPTPRLQVQPMRMFGQTASGGGGAVSWHQKHRGAAGIAAPKRSRSSVCVCACEAVQCVGRQPYWSFV